MTKISRKDCLKKAKNLRKGDLLLWRNYIVPTGKKNKILIILNNLKNDKVIFFILTTSQVKFYTNPQTKIDIMFLKAGKVKCFDKDTIIDLKRWQIKTIREMGMKFYNNTLLFIGRLPEIEIKHLNDAIARAITLSPQTKDSILK